MALLRCTTRRGPLDIATSQTPGGNGGGGVGEPPATIWRTPGSLSAAERTAFNAKWVNFPEATLTYPDDMTYQFAHGDWIYKWQGTQPITWEADNSIRLVVPGTSTNPWCQNWIANLDRKSQFYPHDYRPFRWRWRYTVSYDLFLPTDWNTWLDVESENTPDRQFVNMTTLSPWAWQSRLFSKNDQPKSGRSHWVLQNRYSATDVPTIDSDTTPFYTDSVPAGETNVGESALSDRGWVFLDATGGGSNGYTGANIIGRWVPVQHVFIIHPLLPKAQITWIVDGAQIAHVTGIRDGWYRHGEVGTAFFLQLYTRRHQPPLGDNQHDVWYFLKNVRIDADEPVANTLADSWAGWPSNTPEYFRMWLAGVSTSTLKSHWNERNWALSQSQSNPHLYGAHCYDTSNPENFVRTSFFRNNTAGLTSQIKLSLSTNGSSFNQFLMTVTFNGSTAATYAPASVPTISQLNGRNTITMVRQSSPNAAFSNSVAYVQIGGEY